MWGCIDCLSSFVWRKLPTVSLYRNLSLLICTLQAAALLIVMHAMQPHRQADWQSRELEGHQNRQIYKPYTEIAAPWAPYQCNSCNRSSAEHPRDLHSSWMARVRTFLGVFMMRQCSHTELKIWLGHGNVQHLSLNNIWFCRIGRQNLSHLPGDWAGF